jgi:hypothetical protein
MKWRERELNRMSERDCERAVGERKRDSEREQLEREREREKEGERKREIVRERE